MSVLGLVQAGAGASPTAPTPAQAVSIDPPSGGRTSTINLDLQVKPGSEPVRITSPNAAGFRVVLKNAVPGRRYRLRTDWQIAPTTPFRPVDDALHEDQDLFTPSIQIPTHRPAECAALAGLAESVLAAADEAATAAATTRYRDAAAASSCGSFRRALEWAVASSPRRELPMDYRLYPGDRLTVAIERMADSGSSPEMTWRFEIAPSRPPRAWDYDSEHAWIVGQISRDIVDMARFAQGRNPLAAPPHVAVAPGNADWLGYVVEFPGLDAAPCRREVRLPDYVWSPAGYRPLAAAELGGTRPARAGGDPADALMAALLGARSPQLAREDRRISRRLAANMLDAAAHEEAALLLGVFGLREAAGEFSDIRHTLCRMTAHLAFASALSGADPSRTARLANALLLTLVKRQRDALAEIAALEAAQAPQEGGMLKSLRIRNTRDWRLLAKPAAEPLLVRLEHYRAVETSLTRAHASTFLDSFTPEQISDWARIAGQRGFSVEQGHLLAGSAVDLELQDAAATWQAEHGSAAADRQLAESLNAAPAGLVTIGEGGRPEPRVIGWSMWAQFFQRNLCFEARNAVSFLNSSLRMPAEAEALSGHLRQRLASLGLWPGVELAWFTEVPAVDDVRRASCAAAATLAQRAPQRLPPEVWSTFDQRCFEQKASQELPPISEWLTGLAPAGTALFDPGRLASAARSGDVNVALQQLHPLAPNDRHILELQPRVPPEHQAERIRELYGQLVEYDLTAMYLLAAAQTGEVALAHYDKIAELDPAAYFYLGGTLVDLDREQEAAAAYEKGVERARDALLVAANVQWLIGYYCDNGKLERARALAQMAADVYSGDGLRAMGYLMERLGQYQEAETWYRRILDRYNQRNALDQFYIRYEHRVGDHRYRLQAEEASKRLFPDGMYRVSLSELEGPPQTRSAPVSGRYQKSTRFGLRKGDVVVAVNGYALQNDDQYQLLWTLDDGPAATAIVWRDGAYVEVKGSMKRTRYGRVSQTL